MEFCLSIYQNVESATTTIATLEKETDLFVVTSSHFFSFFQFHSPGSQLSSLAGVLEINETHCLDYYFSGRELGLILV